MNIQDEQDGSSRKLPNKTEIKDEVTEYIRQSICNKQAEEEFGKEACSEKVESILRNLVLPPSFTTLRLNTLTDMDTLILSVQKSLNKQYDERQWENPQVTRHQALPDTLVIENSGPHAITPSPLEVIVDTICGMAILRGSDVFAQGILAAPPGLESGRIVSVYADLDRGCRKGLTKPYTGRKVFLGNGRAAFSRQQLFTSEIPPRGVGVYMTEPMYRAPSLADFLPTCVFPQNLPSIVCGRVLDPQPGECVLDMCAAPGGKTTHLATLMKNKGRVVAFDKSKNKIPKIKDNVSRWGLEIVEAYHFDATRSVDRNADSSGSPPYPPEMFDRVLLDAPCSALGQRPSLKNDISLIEVSSYPPLQRKLFQKAVDLLKPGGILVYSTCTLPVEENEAIVAWALCEYPQLSLSEQSPRLGGPGWPCPGISNDQRRLLQRFGPITDCEQSTVKGDPSNNVNTDTIGFFIAKFIKRRTER